MSALKYAPEAEARYTQLQYLCHTKMKKDKRQKPNKRNKLDKLTTFRELL